MHHLDETDIGREQRLHGGLVHTRHEKHSVGHRLERRQERRGKDVAGARAHCDQQAIGAAELGPMLGEDPHEGVAAGQVLLETGIDLEPGGGHREPDTRQPEDRDRQRPVVEQRVFEPARPAVTAHRPTRRRRCRAAE